MLRRITVLALVMAGCATAPPAPTGESPYVFETRSGEKVEAFRGIFSVPENRSVRNGRTIDLHYVRFPATGAAPGNPIVYLAGGPGGSGVDTARGERFPLFMAMREFGDVIAFDQRGAGWSEAAPECVSDVVIPIDRPVEAGERNALLRQAAEHCAAFWKAAGHDIAGYTTIENARDLDALRAHLGARKISLLAISYGTHLALAAIKEMEPRLDRLVLTGVEGLDQTVKLPSETDAYFARLQEAIARQPAAKAAYPDIKALMRRVHAKLDAAPVMLSLTAKEGPVPMLLTSEVMRRVASALIADPQSASRLLMLYLAVDAGMTEPVAQLIERFITPGAPESFRLMPLAMDIASGIGADRLRRVEREAQTALLGDLLNYPMPQLNGALGLDLGDAFRRAPASDIPTLVLTGTLDGRTYPAEQRAAVGRMRNVTTVTVENAGHNLFMLSPEIIGTIQRFMRGERVETGTIVVDAPKFAPQM